MKKIEEKTNLVIASTNKGKVKEFIHFLSSYPFNIYPQPAGFEVKETGKTFIENARLKAKAVARETGQIAIADDSGLCVFSLKGRPGIHSSRYAKSDKERLDRLLNELEPYRNREACFKAAICLASPDNKILIEVEGQCMGVITNSPRGTSGFGYDPIFEVEGTGNTFAELSISQKQVLGHRGRAFALLKPKLNELFQLSEYDPK